MSLRKIIAGFLCPGISIAWINETLITVPGLIKYSLTPVTMQYCPLLLS